MPVVNEVVTLDQALKLSLSTWDVVIKPFGSGNDLTYPSMALELPGLPSFAGVAIGPRSTIDRCWVEWDPQVKIQMGVPPALVSSPDFFRRLSVEAPLLFPQLGNKQKPASATQSINPLAPLRFGASPNSFQATTLSNRDDVDGVCTPLTFVPGANGSSVAIEPVLTNTQPQLHLVFYLQPPVSQPPTKRHPYEQVLGFTPGTSSPLTTSYGLTIPVHGRKHIRLVFESSGGSVVYNATIGGMICRNTPAQIPTDVSLGTVAAVSPTAPKTITFDNPLVDFINIYATNVSGAAGAQVTVFAYD